MQYKVWWVLAGDNYYPNRDNFVASFDSEEKAKEWVRLERNHDHSHDWYMVIDVSPRLHGAKW